MPTLTLALSKGRLLDESLPLLARAGLVTAEDPRASRKLIIPTTRPGVSIVILRAAGKLKLIWDIRLLYGGRHRNHPAITILRGRKVVVEPLGDVEKNGALVDIDGESPGRIPATFEILPGALTLRY